MILVASVATWPEKIFLITNKLNIIYIHLARNVIKRHIAFSTDNKRDGRHFFPFSQKENDTDLIEGVPAMIQFMNRWSTANSLLNLLAGIAGPF